LSSPADLPTILVSMTVLAGSGLLAGLIPALRASRIDPTLALRWE
jgi:ABC-type antimicrobial peptide transport system permease subunit